MYSSWSSMFVFFSSGLFILFYVWAKWKHSYWQSRGIPSLPTHILFGNLKDSILMKLSTPFLLGRLYRQVDEDAPFVGFYIMHKPYLLLRSPDIIKNVLIKDFDVFSDRYFAAPETSKDLVGSRSLFSLKNPQWRHMRMKLSPTFTTGKLKSLFNLMLESSESFKNYLDHCFENVPTGVKSLDLKDASNRYTTDVISSLAFGVKTDSFQDPAPEFYTKTLEGDTLVAQSALFFIAGLETASTTISFTLWELGKHPDIQARVRRDIHEHLDNSKKVTYESIQEMKYLMAVINETLRMYPPAPLIDRIANRDYKIDGSQVILEKGTVVYISLPGIHMDPRYHPQPDVYDPDRFSEERKSDIKPYTFMPFGEGPRACIGMRIGMLLTAVGLITVLRDHEVSLNRHEWKNGVSKRSIFTAPANGITLNVKKIATM